MKEKKTVPPVCVAGFDERPRVAQLPDGTLLGVYVCSEAHVQNVAAKSSTDCGRTWTMPEALFSLPTKPGRWAGCEVLVDQEGEMHVFLLNDRNTGVLADPSGEEKRKPLGFSELRLDIWHCKTEADRANWRRPQCIWQGYTGSLNSVIQMREGRILLPFSYLTSRTWQDRGEGLDAFWYAGKFSSTLIYSDDGGDTWRPSPSELKVHTPSIGTYGSCEPVVLQLLDGRVWMLVRTQLGRLYESFSPDGITWSPPRPTLMLSSDSPVGLVRLADERIVLLWNKCLRFPYAHGGRHVLHAAISEDDAQTWIGHREVARDPFRHEPPPPRGDHGTAYPFPAALRDGSVIMTTGQGPGGIAIVKIKPAWLCETHQETDFSTGLEDWSVFGCKGVELKKHPRKQEAQVLSIAKIDNEWPAAAVWNFPSGARGRLSIKLCLQEKFGGAHLMLTDHFSVPFDPEDALYALYNVGMSPEGKLADEKQLSPGQWYTVQLEWDCGTRICEVSADGKSIAIVPLRRESEGACYLRVKSTAEEAGEGSLLIESVMVEVER